MSPGTTGGFASESVTYLDVGLTLNAEPTIYLNNEVAIRISLEVATWSRGHHHNRARSPTRSARARRRPCCN